MGEACSGQPLPEVFDISFGYVDSVGNYVAGCAGFGLVGCGDAWWLMLRTSGVDRLENLVRGQGFRAEFTADAAGFHPAEW
jgi:hypothetical protein